ncbi:hypothetical protein G6F60_004932 [Rhizopus arrhizus]|nr:hypothetical protein G6F24_000333 [Rhizopus arrhizus]KAG1384654.1 hypothetical protein G6F61_000255 [Rhizopus arrhizus]KAG1403605.1 hypothetical protein G6F60_004932 [Rhizopus arrhizus]
MSADNIPYILQRKCKDRTGVRITKEYLQSFWNNHSSLVADSEEAYDRLLHDFLHKDLALTSEPVIPENFGSNPVETFPLGHLRHGGGVVLQIQDTTDIRYSTLSLLNNLTNATPVRQVYVERSEDEKVDFTRGMLRWTLTDGKNQIQAIEMEAIPDLSLTTPFGCKILVKSCQVRRGMLLLTKNNIKVLGGDVSELYGGDMLKELESRFKESIGLTENTIPASQPPSHSNALPVSVTNTIPDDEFFDDDFDYAELERMETTTTAVDDIPSDDDFVEDTTGHLLKSIPSDSDSDIYEDAVQEPSLTNSRSSGISLSKKVARPAPSSTDPPRKRISLTNQSTLGSSSTTLHEDEDMVDLTGDDDHPSTQAELEEISWVDDSVWADLNEASKENLNGDVFVDDQGKTHITFSKLQQTLKAMENDNYSTNLPDTVIVRAKCVQFGKLVTSNRLYSLVLYFDDPDQATGQPVQIVFSNDALTKLLNAKRQDVINVNAAGGQKAVLRQIFKPFDKKVRNSIADIEIDLSITQKSENSFLMPMGIGYSNTKQSMHHQ